MSRYFGIDYEFSPSKVRERIDACIAAGKGGSYICVVDGNILSRVNSDKGYAETVSGAMFSICDSSWVPLYLKLLYGFKPEQYCGSQIFKDLTEQRRYRMAFLGASEEVLEALRQRLSEVDPEIECMSFIPLPFKKVEEFDYEGIAAMINEISPDIVWLSLGAPKQEIFASKLSPRLKRGVIIPVGAVFNFRAGLGIRRAPEWMIRAHLEWIHRIFKEPRKQLRRVVTILSTTPSILYKEWRHSHSSSNS